MNTEKDTWKLGNHEFNYDFEDTTNAIEDFEGDMAIASLYERIVGAGWLL